MDDSDVHLIETVKGDDEHVVWVTADIRQGKNPEEREALRGSGMSVVFFKRFHKQKPHWQAMKVLAVWPTICHYCQTSKLPRAYVVPSGSPSSPKVDVLGNTNDKRWKSP